MRSTPALELDVATLPTTVAWVTVAVPATDIAPPWLATLALKVEFDTVVLPVSRSPPPLPVAVLVSIVLLVTVMVPSLLTPPPSTALLPVTVEFTSASTPPRATLMPPPLPLVRDPPVMVIPSMVAPAFLALTLTTRFPAAPTRTTALPGTADFSLVPSPEMLTTAASW